MKVIPLFLIIIFSFLNPVFAQVDSLGFDTSGINEAVLELIKLGNKHVNDEEHDDALKFYFGAYDFMAENAVLNFKIADCYLNSVTEDKTQSIPYFEKALKADSLVHKDVLFFVGRAYHLNYEWDKAIQAYEAYLQRYPSKRERVKKGIQECKFGKSIMHKKTRVLTRNMGPTINSKYADFCPVVISSNQNVIYFTSRRHERPDLRTHINEDVYMVEKVGEDWQVPKILDAHVNAGLHNATVSATADGLGLVVYKHEDLFETYYKKGEWENPKKLPENINSKYRETSASFSADGNTVYFISDRDDMSFGGTDIFRAVKDEKGNWGAPENLGATINTKYDEEGVFIHADNQTLYFSSRGHTGMGGYDIFKSVYDSHTKTWSTPENLGLPVNTPDDDVFFILDEKGRHGYYSSAHKNGYGDKDIYEVVILGPEKALIFDTEETLTVQEGESDVKITASQELDIMMNKVYQKTKATISILKQEAQPEN